MEEAVTAALGFLAAYGYVVMFVWMFADQAALPIPAVPLLIAAGALSATGDLDIVGVVAAASAGTLLADSLWYVIGRYGGGRAIGWICRLSIEPDSCVTTTRNTFARLGPMTLVVAKYVPGVQTLAPASAGFAKASFVGFLVLDFVGTLLFILPFCLGGFFYQAQLGAAVDAISEISGGLLMAVLAIAAAYGALKAGQWILFYRGHRLRRLTTESLKSRLDDGEPTTIIDLRQTFDYKLEPRIIPGAMRIPISEVSSRQAEIPTEYDIVLVCT